LNITTMTIPLSDLPNEIILAIAKELHSESAINALARTSRHLYSLLNPFLYQYHEHPKIPALHWAAQGGYSSTLISLLDAGVDLYASPIWYPDQTHTLTHHPLITAIWNGHLNIVELLLDRGGMSERLKEEDYELPLNRAIWYGHMPILQFFLQKGVNPWNTRKIESALVAAVRRGCPEILKLLLRDAEHRQLLDPARLLQELGHALWVAAHHGNDELIHLLLAEGADVNFRWDGTTSLDSAVINDHYSTAKILLQVGADPKMVDCDYIGPLSRAAKPSEGIWLRQGTRRYQRPRDSSHLVVPYPQVVRDELVAMTRLLLDYGADAAGSDGATALRLAMRSKNPELTNLLLAHDARVLGINRTIHGANEGNSYWV
jgi:ankyrin repeat protein